MNFTPRGVAVAQRLNDAYFPALTSTSSGFAELPVAGLTTLHLHIDRISVKAKRMKRLRVSYVAAQIYRCITAYLQESPFIAAPIDYHHYQELLLSEPR